ncbi:hypothetical protein [uncultured Sphingorhabdus sp.]|uniref:hypothetical protein n=1 Tax=uncultured Sphingorhabdus sp. TaxID=1686106 RepID=UPI002638317C|nr:hypothetical protein [uncultured Sphingorhabdus sp.]HMS20515.1 hypothetical protein [Sphingorhabdus sp.]
MGTVSNISTSPDNLVADMTVSEFLVGMALSRLGVSTSSAVAEEVSRWIERSVPVAEIFPSLSKLVARGWVQLEEGTYIILQAGMDAIASFYAIALRVLDRGQKLLDVGLFLSIMKKLEESSR